MTTDAPAHRRASIRNLRQQEIERGATIEYAQHPDERQVRYRTAGLASLHRPLGHARSEGELELAVAPAKPALGQTPA
jgi:hypothetical protein